ncbi:MAG: hypothetical protein WBR18_02320 [Anaerolineales bacterium]
MNPGNTSRPKLAKIEREVEKINLQEKRLLDAYREGIIELDELKAQKEKIAAQLWVVNARYRVATKALDSHRAQEITFADLQRPFSRISKRDAQSKQGDQRKTRQFTHQSSEAPPRQSGC